MRIFGVAVLAASLFVTGLSVASAEPLRPGYPAGVQKARGGSVNTAVKIGAGGAVMLAVGILASGNSSVVDSLQIKSQGVIVPPTVVTVSTSTSSTSTTGTP